MIVQISIDDFIANDFIKYFIQAALVEECFKFLILYRYKNLIFDSFDSIKYGVLISLGFAMIENIGYAFKGIEWGIGGYETVAIRMFSSIPGHFIFGLNMGYLFGLSQRNKKYASLYVMMSLICPILIHGSYDYFDFPLGYGVLILAILLNYSPLKYFLTFNN